MTSECAAAAAAVVVVVVVVSGGNAEMDKWHSDMIIRPPIHSFLKSRAKRRKFRDEMIEEEAGDLILFCQKTLQPPVDCCCCC